MATALFSLTLFAVHAVSLSPQTVPANGLQEVLMTLDAPAAVHVSARSGSGTACEVVDRVRGPFAHAGTAGSTNCELDLLLDAGQYKLRLDSANRGKGQVTVSATPYSEINATPVRLIPQSGVVTTLKPQQQASFWLTLENRAVPFIRISGRHAGDVRLWRNGQWLEPMTLQHTQFAAAPGRMQHEWWVDSTLEAGDYQLVVYGRDSATVTGSSVDDSLTIEYGFREAPAEASVPFTLGPSGVLAIELPRADYAAIVSLAASPKSPVNLQSYTRGMRSAQSECRIEKDALVPECSTWVSAPRSNTEWPSVLLLRGPPGTRGFLEWAPWSDGGQRYGGYYGPSTSSLQFGVRQAGKYLVAVNDFPNDTDGPPLGCQLEELKDTGDVAQVVARAAIRVNAGERFERAFNFPDEGTVIWFEIGSGGSLLQRTGLSSRRFKIAVTGKGTCEVYRMGAVGSTGELKRLTQSKPEGTECSEVLALDPGMYQLQLPSALSGIRTLTIQEEGSTNAPLVSTSGACNLGSQTLNASRYRVVLSRTGAVRVRGLTVEALPIASTIHLPFDAKQKLSFPVSPSTPISIRASALAPFTCSSESGKAVSSANGCELPAGADTVTIENPGTAPIAITVVKAGSTKPLLTPQAYSPTIKPLPRITPDTPTFFDFEHEQSQSVTFDVEAAGLYNVTTQGLLATRCVLRTPAIERVAENVGAGRGRNCLIQTWLQKGRYLMTASTVGQSQGRGALFLSRRNAKEFASINGEGDQFFRVDANDLVQQKLTVRTQAAYQVGTTAQGVTGLQCRLDDPDGWPLETVPTACTGERTMRAGTWLWTQLPLTVESMRHSQLTRVREPVVLKGNKAHPIDFFTWYSAELGTDGKDEFLFTLEGETQLDVVLTAGMQGRVYLLEKDKAPKAVEVVPPQALETGEQAPEPEQEQPSESGDGEREPMREEEGNPNYGNNEGDEGNEPAPTSQGVPTVQAHAAPPPPAGVKLTLPSGQYKLVTEHSRGDVGVTYRLHFGSATLQPGMTRTLPTPSLLPISIPRDGTLRLRTSGDADVRCRVLDASGKLVFEGSDNGADWNCAIAEPITKGRYTLVLESETQQRGETKLTLTLPTVDDLGLITDGAKATLGNSVVAWRVPVAEKDAVQEITLKALGKTPISCALEDSRGVVALRRSRVAECSLLVRPKLENWRVRAWTTDGTAQIQAAFRSRTIVEGSVGEAPADKAISLNVSHAGRYRTGSPIFCIAGKDVGVLRPCGPEVSLEKGSVVFTTTGTKAQSLALDEQLATPSEAAVMVNLNRLPYLQNISAAKPALFLLEARVQHGERAAPSCAFDGSGTVRERRDNACFAVSAVGTSATMRLWAPSESDLETGTIRSSAVLPEKFDPLTPGHKQVTFTGGVGRFALPPNVRSRVELVIPKRAWAVLLDDRGASVDVCAPTTELRRCLLTGQGGSVAIISKDGLADISTTLLEGLPAAVAFTGLYEESARQPGSLRLNVEAADIERMATIEGALHCTVALADGTRLASCRAKVPAKTQAELLIEYGVGPVRAMVHPVGREKWARLGLELPVLPGGSLPPSVGVPVTGQSGRLDRTLVVEHEAVVRVSSESGVCGLFKGNDLLSVDGLDTGCELVRVLAPGTYRLLVRPFAARVIPGMLKWTAESVSQLSEGIGAETWLAPGDVRLFRFDTANPGKLGLGIQASSELLDCAVYNDGYQLVGEGCHQYLSLDKGRYLLTVKNPAAAGAVPRSFKPVLLGLKGDTHDIPDEYLQDFFRRVEVRP